MVSAELQKYVTEQRQAGISDEVLHRTLLESGWPLAAVEEVLKPVQPETVVQARVRPHRLLFIVVMACLIFLLVGIGLAYVALRYLGATRLGY
jgi:hypothetical protein